MLPEPAVVDVSVIVPAWRAAATVGRALASVAAQTARPLEAIVVDDGSDDGTADAARALAPRMNGVGLVVLKQPHAGAGAARNRALAQARGRYVAFLDADDEWLPGKLARSLHHLEKGGHVLVAHDALAVEPGGGTRAILCSARFRAARDPYDALYRLGYIGTCTVVARADAVRAGGGFDETLPAAQDFDLWLKVLAPRDASFTVFPEALSRYHVSAGGITANTARRLDCCLAVAARHRATLRARGIAPLPSHLFRIAAVHREAITAHAARGAWGACLSTVLRLPARLAMAAAGDYNDGPPA